MDINSNRFLSIEELQSRYLNNDKSQNISSKTSEGASFRDILTQKSNEGAEVKFSKHAANRLASRKIELTDAQMDRLNQGAQKAQMKGIRESLVLVDSLAFIVNVPNNTVVTAMNSDETEDNIFTNIDGAVII